GELAPLHRARGHVLLRRQVTDHDRATRSLRRQLDDVHVLVRGVVIEVEADLVAVEGHRSGDVRHGQDHDFEGPVHPCHDASRWTSTTTAPTSTSTSTTTTTGPTPTSRTRRPSRPTGTTRTSSSGRAPTAPFRQPIARPS